MSENNSNRAIINAASQQLTGIHIKPRDTHAENVINALGQSWGLIELENGACKSQLGMLLLPQLFYFFMAVIASQCIRKKLIN